MINFFSFFRILTAQKYSRMISHKTPQSRFFKYLFLYKSSSSCIFISRAWKNQLFHLFLHCK